VSRRDPQARKSHLFVEGPSTAAELVVLDGALNRVARTVGKFQGNVEPGLYRVTARLGNAAEQKHLEIKRGQHAAIRANEWSVQFAASMPLEGTFTSRETHQAPAQEWSRKLTFPDSRGEGRLFIFARRVSTHGKKQQPPHEDRWKDMALLEGTGGEITRFAKSDVASNPRDFWIAFTGDLQEGAYRLRLQGADANGERRPIELPLWLTARYETQVFVTWIDPSPMPVIGLSMPRKGKGFVAFDSDRQHEARIAELALGGLQRRKNLLSGRDLNILLFGKFENPWLGIIGAHCVMLDGEPKPGTLRTICRNLTIMLGDHPDVLALRLALGEEVKNLAFPPILRAGMAVVLDCATCRKTVIQAGSLLDSLASAMTPNGPWTSWCPDRLHQRALAQHDPKREAQASLVSSPNFTGNTDQGSVRPFGHALHFMEWLGIDDISRGPVDFKAAQRILARTQSAAGVRRLAMALNVPLSTAEAVLETARSGEARELSSGRVALLDQARAYWRRKFDEEAKPQLRQQDLLDVLNEESERYLSLDHTPTRSSSSVLILNEIVQQGRDEKERPFMIILSRDRYWAHPAIPKAVVQAIMISEDGSGTGGESSVQLDQGQGASVVPIWRTGVGRYVAGAYVHYLLIWATLPNVQTKDLRQAVARHESKEKLNGGATQFRTAVRIAQSGKDNRAHKHVGDIAAGLTRELGALL
jgi:hypothetical protein